MSSATANLKTATSTQTLTAATSAHMFPATIIGTAMKALKYQHIAPAPPGHTSDSNKSLVRKYATQHPTRTAAHNSSSSGSSNSGLPYSVDQTQSVQRRNARERNRVKQVNNSFVRLRQHIPQSIITDLTKGGGRGPHKKISKVDTLRIAVEYIRRLQDVVDDFNVSEAESCSGGSCQASDTASNSSFSSHSSHSSRHSSSSNSSTALDVPSQLYYGDASPIGGELVLLPTLGKHKDVQLPAKQQYATSGLLTPVSLRSYSPQRQTAHHDAGCQSPTSSFNSSMSSYDATSGYEQPTALTQLSPPHHQHYANNATSASGSSEHIGATAATAAHLLHSQTHLNAHLQLKFEPYEHFSLRDDDCTPDDEEILDYISLWQEE